jgi:hypothetical protein
MEPTVSTIEAVTDLPQRLRAANNAQRGSFGEFLFAGLARELDAGARATRRNRTDFVYGDLPIDVKTTIRDIGQSLRPLTPYRGSRVKGTSYAQVEFGSEGARVSLEADVLQMITWPDLATAWRKWGKEKPPRSVGDLGPLRARVAACFRELGLRVRVIYRTTQAAFGKESPANLVPTRPDPARITVFLDFARAPLTEDNILRIIAFPDAAGKSLPLLERPHLHRPKVDLSRLPARFVFSSLSELFRQAKCLKEALKDEHQNEHAPLQDRRRMP